MTRWRLVLSAALVTTAALAVVLAVDRIGSSDGPVFAQDGPSLQIDTDLSDGCTTITNTATVSVGTEFTVGICAVDHTTAPGDGNVQTFAAKVGYTADFSGQDGPFDGNTDLDANPDFNQGSETGGTTWDCNLFNMAATQPKASTSPATIGCTWTGAGEASLGGPPALMATVTLTAETEVTPTGDNLTWTSGELDFGSLARCGFEMECFGAEVTVTGLPTATSTPLPPTPTDTPLPPTATPTPSCGGPDQPTCTPVPTQPTERRATETPRPTEVPEATETPVVPTTVPTEPPPTLPPPVPTETPWGGPGAVVVPPVTGTGAGGGGGLLWLWLGLGLAGAALAAGASGWHLLRHVRARSLDGQS